MSFQKLFFTAIDKLFDRPQNERAGTDYINNDILVDRDIVYNDSAPRDCTLDIYRVQQDDSYPVLLYVHGGGFEAGDKEYRRLIARWGAVNGLFVANVNYGLCPKYKCPEPHRHLVAALNWLGSNAAKYNLDLSRIMISGDSAGAYYALFLVCLSLDSRLQGELGVHTDLKFSAAAFVCGVYDVVALLKKCYLPNVAVNIFKDITGIEPSELEGYRWKNLCTITDYINADFPPCFITHSQNDIFCRGQAEILEEALIRNGVYYEQYCAKKLADNHCFSINSNSEAAIENNKLLADFIERFKEGNLSSRTEKKATE